MTVTVTTKPTDKPSWLSTTVGSIIAPDSAKKTAGWLAEKPPFQNFNWFWNIMSRWVDYVDVIQNDIDMTINCADQADFLAVIAYLNLVRVNNGTITINNAAATINVPITLHGITGTGTIQINGNTAYSGIYINGVLNTVKFIGAVSSELSAYNALNPNAVLCKNSNLVTFSSLSSGFGYTVTAGYSPLSRLIKIENTEVIAQTLTLDGGSTSGVLAKYLVEIKRSGSLQITSSAAATVTDGVPDAHGWAYIYLDKTSSFKGAPIFTADMYPVQLFGEYIPTLDFALNMKATSANSMRCEEMLALLVKVDCILNVDLDNNRRYALTMENLSGSGVLNLDGIVSDHTKSFFLSNCSLQINIELIQATHNNASPTNQPIRVYNCPNTYINYLGVVVTTGASGYAAEFKKCSGTIHQIIVMDGSNLFDDDKYVLIEESSMTVESINHIFTDVAVKVITAKRSNVRVESATTISDANAAVRVQNGSQLICRNPLPNFDVFYNGDVAAL